MKLIETKIKIDASPERVWSILTNLKKYSEWNPFIQNAKGTVGVGEKLEILIAPPKGKKMVFKPIVKSVIENSEFIWLGRLWLPGIFDGEHIFTIENKNGESLFIHKEKFSGLLVPMMWSSLNVKTRAGFELMNESLKERVEKEAM